MMVSYLEAEKGEIINQDFYLLYYEEDIKNLVPGLITEDHHILHPLLLPHHMRSSLNILVKVKYM